MNEKDYFYWNNLPNLIPSDLSTLNQQEKKELLKKWDEAVWTKNVQDGDQILGNIKELPGIKIIVPEWIMDRLKEAADHYVKGQWLSSIALVAVTCEFLNDEEVNKKLKIFVNRCYHPDRISSYTSLSLYTELIDSNSDKIFWFTDKEDLLQKVEGALRLNRFEKARGMT